MDTSLVQQPIKFKLYVENIEKVIDASSHQILHCNKRNIRLKKLYLLWKNGDTHFDFDFII